MVGERICGHRRIRAYRCLHGCRSVPTGQRFGKVGNVATCRPAVGAKCLILHAFRSETVLDVAQCLGYSGGEGGNHSTSIHAGCELSFPAMPTPMPTGDSDARPSSPPLIEGSRMTEKCGECRHWEPPEDPEDFNEGGRCLRYPPVYDHDWVAKHSAECPEFSAGNSYVFWAWPVTIANTPQRL